MVITLHHLETQGNHVRAEHHQVGLFGSLLEIGTRPQQCLAPPDGVFSAYGDQLLRNAGSFDSNVAQLQEVIRVKRRYEVLKTPSTTTSRSDSGGDEDGGCGGSTGGDGTGRSDQDERPDRDPEYRDSPPHRAPDDQQRGPPYIVTQLVLNPKSDSLPLRPLSAANSEYSMTSGSDCSDTGFEPKTDYSSNPTTEGSERSTESWVKEWRNAVSSDDVIEEE